MNGVLNSPKIFQACFELDATRVSFVDGPHGRRRAPCRAQPRDTISECRPFA